MYKKYPHRRRTKRKKKSSRKDKEKMDLEDPNMRCDRNSKRRKRKNRCEEIRLILEENYPELAGCGVSRL